ncbi:hypothetical protein PVL29_022825 [Vitis rotundifolia]|uniref:Uncharacterized protein n=1 Tax=Vitis rotundifolia TaxID=103349 RepID=A0AA39DC19_VITRO|nr:hypothetical protein PVL29_022825 [Vitis rotundifolia]
MHTTLTQQENCTIYQYENLCCMRLITSQTCRFIGNDCSSLWKDVAVVTHMINTNRSMRCFLKGTSSSPLVQFSSLSEDTNDLDDGGGTPAFLFWPISSFEKLAEELVQMFILEQNLKRLLVVELLSISCEEAPQDDRYCWTDELYPGEFDDLGICSLHSKEIGELVLLKIIGFGSHSPVIRSNQQPDHEILQVLPICRYLLHKNAMIHFLISDQLHF